MKTHRELQQLGLDSFTIAQFTGTSTYYRISRRHLLTDGTKHLAEKGACFWMMDAIASHLCKRPANTPCLLNNYRARGTQR